MISDITLNINKSVDLVKISLTTTNIIVLLFITELLACYLFMGSFFIDVKNIRACYRHRWGERGEKEKFRDIAKILEYKKYMVNLIKPVGSVP